MTPHDPDTPSPLHRPNPYNCFPELTPDEDGPVEINYLTDPATECCQCLHCHGCLDDEDAMQTLCAALGIAWPPR